MMPLTITGEITAEPGHEDAVEAALVKLVAPTRQESGCIQYDLHRDNDHAGHFLFFENWESRELWQTHMSAPHIQNYLDEVEGKVSAFTLTELTKIA